MIRNTKIILAAMIIAGLSVITGLTMAKDNDKDGGDIKSNIANVLKSDLRQRIQVEETSAGNMAWITGAKIVEISGLGTTTSKLIKVKIFGQDYKIEVFAGTNVVRQHWGKSEIDLSEFSVGDIINVYGTLDSTDYFLIHAKTVRNVSIQKLHAVFTGNILSVSSSTNSFTMEAKRTGANTLIVNTDANTKIYSGKILKSFSDLQVGTKVTVRGIWDRALSKIQALLVRIKPTETEDDD